MVSIISIAGISIMAWVRIPPNIAAWDPLGSNPLRLWSISELRPKIGVPYFGVLIIRILLFRVLY